MSRENYARAANLNRRNHGSEAYITENRFRYHTLLQDNEIQCRGMYNDRLPSRCLVPTHRRKICKDAIRKTAMITGSNQIQRVSEEQIYPSVHESVRHLNCQFVHEPSAHIYEHVKPRSQQVLDQMCVNGQGDYFHEKQRTGLENESKHTNRNHKSRSKYICSYYVDDEIAGPSKAARLPIINIDEYAEAHTSRAKVKKSKSFSQRDSLTSMKSKSDLKSHSTKIPIHRNAKRGQLKKIIQSKDDIYLKNQSSHNCNFKAKDEVEVLFTREVKSFQDNKTEKRRADIFGFCKSNRTTQPVYFMHKKHNNVKRTCKCYTEDKNFQNKVESYKLVTFPSKTCNTNVKRKDLDNVCTAKNCLKCTQTAKDCLNSKRRNNKQESARCEKNTAAKTKKKPTNVQFHQCECITQIKGGKKCWKSFGRGVSMCIRNFLIGLLALIWLPFIFVGYMFGMLLDRIMKPAKPCTCKILVSKIQKNLRCVTKPEAQQTKLQQEQCARKDAETRKQRKMGAGDYDPNETKIKNRKKGSGKKCWKSFAQAVCSCVRNFFIGLLALIWLPFIFVGYMCGMLLDRVMKPAKACTCKILLNEAQKNLRRIMKQKRKQEKREMKNKNKNNKRKKKDRKLKKRSSDKGLQVTCFNVSEKCQTPWFTHSRHKTPENSIRTILENNYEQNPIINKGKVKELTQQVCFCHAKKNRNKPEAAHNIPEIRKESILKTSHKPPKCDCVTVEAKRRPTTPPKTLECKICEKKLEQLICDQIERAKCEGNKETNEKNKQRPKPCCLREKSPEKLFENQGKRILYEDKVCDCKVKKKKRGINTMIKIKSKEKQKTNETNLNLKTSGTNPEQLTPLKRKTLLDTLECMCNMKKVKMTSTEQDSKTQKSKATGPSKPWRRKKENEEKEFENTATKPRAGRRVLKWPKSKKIQNKDDEKTVTKPPAGKRVLKWPKTKKVQNKVDQKTASKPRARRRVLKGPKSKKLQNKTKKNPKSKLGRMKDIRDLEKVVWGDFWSQECGPPQKRKKVAICATICTAYRQCMHALLIIMAACIWLPWIAFGVIAFRGMCLCLGR